METHGSAATDAELLLPRACTCTIQQHCSHALFAGTEEVVVAQQDAQRLLLLQKRTRGDPLLKGIVCITYTTRERMSYRRTGESTTMSNSSFHTGFSSLDLVLVCKHPKGWNASA